MIIILLVCPYAIWACAVKHANKSHERDLQNLTITLIVKVGEPKGPSSRPVAGTFSPFFPQLYSPFPHFPYVIGKSQLKLSFFP